MSHPLPDGPILTPDAWTGPAMAAEGGWLQPLSPAETDELLAARRSALSTGKPMRDWTRADFPLPGLAARIAGWLAELDRGRGFVLLRGFPVEAHDETTLAEVYWGLGLHLGRAISQNTDGDLIGHIRDTGADPAAYGVRLYKTRAEQDFHTDGADIIGLFCLKSAKSGGVSRIVSSPAIFNRMLAERSDLIPVLFEPFPFDTQGQHKPGQRPWFDLPICRWDGDRLRTFFIAWYIRESQQHAETPRLTGAQQEALAFIETTANDPALYLDMSFQPGDMQFLKNAAVLHKRTEYEDWPEPERRRHLLRLWLVEEAFSAGDAALRKGVAPGE
ncbi:TauD/TfdA family dioxygenase [Phenylobacterium sp.]|uniref:TauD/TfdA family dioxygenase n=1 Tax=Phenylobacterium sp. TaxID=1871053 RepID=UPI0035AFB06F